MKTVWIGIALVAGFGTARADDRAASITLGGLGMMQEGPDVEQLFETASGVRLTLAWENAPLPYPDRRGYNTGVALVPELIVGALMPEADRAEALIGAGLRWEFKISQREGGLLRVNGKGAIYLATRGIVVGDNRDVIAEGVLGYYFYLGSPLRLGFELGVTQRYSDAMDIDPIGLMIGFNLGWAPR